MHEIELCLLLEEIVGYNFKFMKEGGGRFTIFGSRDGYFFWIFSILLAFELDMVERGPIQ